MTPKEQQLTHTNNGTDYLLIEVPEGSWDYQVYDGEDNDGVPFIDWFESKGEGIGSINLPPGSYEIVGLASDLDEEQWKGVVQGSKSGLFRDYETTISIGSNYTVITGIRSATESGQSLLSSYKLKMETTLVIKK